MTWLTIVNAVRTWLFKHPSALLAVALLAVIGYHRFADPRAEAKAFNNGRASLQTEARASITQYVKAMNAQVAKRDSAIAATNKADVALTKAKKNYTEKRAALPPQPPAVEEVLDAADAVVLASSDFQKAVITERIVTDTLIQIDTAQVHSLSIDNTALRTENAELKKRPTRKKAAALAVFSAVLAALTTYGATR